MFVIFVCWVAIGVYLLQIDHPKAQIVMGLGIFYFSFLWMPIFYLLQIQRREIQKIHLKRPEVARRL